MNILIATDTKYLPHAKAMLMSLRSHMPNESITVYLFYHALSDSDIKDMSNFLKTKQNMDLVATKIDSSPFDNCKFKSHFTIEISYRLMAQELLPKNLDRILWLDSDIIINSSLKDLYDMDMGRSFVAAAKARKGFTDHNQRLGMPESRVYFNSGVLLMNIARMREEPMLERYVDIVNDYGDRLEYLDQDILNLAFQGDDVIYFDASKYNYQITTDFSMSSRDFKDFLSNCAVMHFASKGKPWMLMYHNRLHRFYWKYAKKANGMSKYIKYLLAAPITTAYFRFRTRGRAKNI